MSKPITVQQRVAELVAEHGSYRKAGRALGVNYSYLYRMGAGKKNPLGTMLRRIGIDPRSATYQRLQPKSVCAKNENANRK